MPLIDLSHTSHSQAQTGIQRVCRNLYAELKRQVETAAITFDPYEKTWRGLRPWEQRNLSATEAALKRGSKWPLSAQWSGRLRRLLGSSGAAPHIKDGLIVPEVFSPTGARNLSALFASTSRPRVALFHDAIALKFPELSPPGTVARFPAYLQELLAFDGIAAVSEDSRLSLLEYWGWLGVTKTPPVHTIPLPVTRFEGDGGSKPRSAGSRLRVLSLGSLEGRKNHVALLQACDALWRKGLQFELHLIGMAHRTTGRQALEWVHTLRSSGRSLRYDGPVSDAQVAAAYRECDFTIYPSLIEGFGLPVLESLAHGKPCICSGRGALGESAFGGGCLTLDQVDAPSLAAALEALLTDPALREKLRQEALQRTFKTWPEYTREVLGWMRTLRV